MPSFSGLRRYRCKACGLVFDESDPRWWDSGSAPQMGASSHRCPDGLSGACELIGTAAQVTADRLRREVNDGGASE